MKKQETEPSSVYYTLCSYFQEQNCFGSSKSHEDLKRLDHSNAVERVGDETMSLCLSLRSFQPLILSKAANSDVNDVSLELSLA